MTSTGKGASLRRVEAGVYRTRDDRFEIRASGYQRTGTTWRIVDLTGRTPFYAFGQQRASKIVDTLAGARQMIENAREREVRRRD